jgi:cytochrome c551/c552
MFAATQKAMDRNNDLRTYGNRLGNLPPDERKSIINGSAIFNSLCVTCHGAGGKGMTVAGSNSLAAPVLVDSKRMNADKATLIKILLHGLQGPIDGKEFPSVMPSLGANSNEWVASAVNYIRYEFGNAGRRFRRPGDTTSPFVSLPEVEAVRKQYETRTALWTLEELETGAPAAVVAKPSADSASGNIAAAPAKKTGTAAAKKPVAKTRVSSKKIDYAAVAPLLQKYTCLTCHQPNTKVIGPSYSEVAAKKYSVAQLVQLIQKPNPANWPGYDTKMPPMGHVPVNELTQIAQWIKSLEKAK